MLIDDVKARIRSAMKAKNAHERDVLKVALGEIQLAETRKGTALSEDEAQAAVKKVVKGNREMIASVNDPEVVRRMETEIAILSSLLPQTLSEDQIIEVLAPVLDGIRGAGGDGQATGVAMKHLKAGIHAVDGQTVSAAVRRLRADG